MSNLIINSNLSVKDCKHFSVCLSKWRLKDDWLSDKIFRIMAPLVFLICYPSQILILLPGWTPLCSERYCAHRNGFTGKKYKELQGINYNYWHQLYITHYSSPHQASSDPCRGWHAASTDQPMTITYYVLWLQLNNIELGFWFPFYLLKTAFSSFSFSRKS